MITNRKGITESPEHEVALDCIEAAIDAVQPESVTNAEVELENNIRSSR